MCCQDIGSSPFAAEIDLCLFICFFNIYLPRDYNSKKMSKLPFSAEINGKAVILATGGFSADKKEDASLLHEFASDKVSFLMHSHFHSSFDSIIVRKIVFESIKFSYCAMVRNVRNLKISNCW